MPLVFTADLQAPISFRTLSTEAARTAEDLLRRQPGSIEPVLYESGNPFVTTLPPLAPTVADLMQVPHEPHAQVEAILTYYSPLDGTRIRVHLGGVFAESLKTCASTFAAITVVLAAVKINGGSRLVFNAWEYCAWLEPDKDDEGQPLDTVVDCLRVSPGNRTMDNAIRELMERTMHPCSEFVNSDIPVKQ